MSVPRIVILGAGFGGVYVAKELRSLAKKGLVDLTLVNRTNYFLFTPLLHEVATGGLNPRNVAEPLREIFVGSGIRVVQGLVESVDLENKIVAIDSRPGGCALSYDYLVVATGAETNHYGIPGAAEFTLPLKSLMDAAQIRNRIIDVFERASLVESIEERRELLSFVVVGGGATGVEVVAELAEFMNGLIKRYFTCPIEASLTLIHTGQELLEMFAPRLRRIAEKKLRKKGVTLKLKSQVVQVTAEGLRLADGLLVPARTIIWAAGVKASIPKFVGRIPTLSSGRLAVDQFFRLVGENKVFALGDNAAYLDCQLFQKDSQNTKPLPMLAQVAVREASRVAENLLASLKDRPLQSFRYRSKGSMVSIGQWFAVGEIDFFNFSGRLAWWIWRTVYLFKFASWQKRLRIMVDWSLDFFYPRDITKLT